MIFAIKSLLIRYLEIQKYLEVEKYVTLSFVPFFIQMMREIILKINSNNLLAMNDEQKNEVERAMASSVVALSNQIKIKFNLKQMEITVSYILLQEKFFIFCKSEITFQIHK